MRTIDDFAGWRYCPQVIIDNRPGKPVRMLYVLMDARFDPELKQVL